MTSPVLFISGPRMGSASGNLVNGKTASFTEKYGGTTSDVTPAQRMEHTVVTAPGTRAELVKLIQRQEKAGWEFCGSVSVADASELVFKRPKGGSSPPSSRWSPSVARGWRNW